MQMINSKSKRNTYKLKLNSATLAADKVKPSADRMRSFEVEVRL